MSTTDGHYETYLAGYGAGIDEGISPEQEATVIDQAYQAGYADGERDQRHRSSAGYPADVREFPRAQELKRRAIEASVEVLQERCDTLLGGIVLITPKGNKGIGLVPSGRAVLNPNAVASLVVEAAWSFLADRLAAAREATPRAQAWLPEVLAEQERAKLLGENDHTKVKRAGRPVMFDHGDDPRWLPALDRELGEVAHAMIYEDSGADLAVELIQVAAVAVSWREALRRDSLRRMVREGEAAGIYDLPPEPTDPRAGG